MNYADFYHNHRFLFDVDGRFSLSATSLDEDSFIIHLHVGKLTPEEVQLSAALLALNLAYVENNMASTCLDAETHNIFLVKTQSLDGFDVNAFEALLSTLCMQGETFQDEFTTFKSHMQLT